MSSSISRIRFLQHSSLRIVALAYVLAVASLGCEDSNSPTVQCELSADLLDYGTLVQGQSDTLQLQLINRGPSFDLEEEFGATCSLFSVVNMSNYDELGTGETLAVAIEFSSDDVGTFDCELGTSNLPCSVQVKAIVIVPPCQIRHSILNFGSVLTSGNGSRVQTWIRNSSSVQLFPDLDDSECESYRIVDYGVETNGIAAGDSIAVEIAYEPFMQAIGEYCQIETGLEGCSAIRCLGTALDPLDIEADFDFDGEVDNDEDSYPRSRNLVVEIEVPTTDEKAYVDILYRRAGESQFKTYLRTSDFTVRTNSDNIRNYRVGGRSSDPFYRGHYDFKIIVYRIGLDIPEDSSGHPEESWLSNLPFESAFED